MYIRLRLNKSGTTTVYLLDSIRVDGKKYAVTKVVKCFGSTSDQSILNTWRMEAELLKSQLAKQKITARKFISIKQEQDISSCTVEEFGMKYLYDQVFQSIFSNLTLEGVDKELLANLVIMRIAMPVSKLRTASISRDFGMSGLTINKIYKMMDALSDDKIEAIKKLILQNTKALIGGKIKVVFYDLTTVYFEANSQSELKEFGFSKDGKHQHVQISLALIVTEGGMPVVKSKKKSPRFGK